MGNALSPLLLPPNIEREIPNFTPVSSERTANSVFESLIRIRRLDDSTELTLLLSSCHFENQASSPKEKANSPYLASLYRLEHTPLAASEEGLAARPKRGLIALMEPIANRLRSVYESRMRKDEYFLEVDILRILDHVVSALMALRIKNRAHGGIDLSHIYLSQDGTYKLLDLELIFGESASYYFALSHPEQAKELCLSPALLKSLKKARSPPESNKEKDDIFALGMVALELHTMESSRRFYGKKGFKIDFKMLKEKIEKLEASTTPNFSKIIKSMLEKDESRRPNAYELFQAIMNFNSSVPLTPMNSVDSVYLKSSGFQSLPPGKVISQFELEESMVASISVREEGKLMSQLTPLSNRRGVYDSTENTENIYISMGDSSRPNKPDAKYSTPIRVEDKIHIAPPGSLGKNVIKIVYTPTRESQEKLQEVEKEYQFNKERLDKENKSKNKSLNFLSEAIDFLKTTNSSPHKSVDSYELFTKLASPSKGKEDK